jgi:hypothetical protein
MVAFEKRDESPRKSRQCERRRIRGERVRI